MSQFNIRSITDNFEYSYLPSNFEEKQLTSFSEWIYTGHHTNINKKMNSEINSEWIIRNYLSTKMILAATVMLNSLDYAKQKNLKVVVPYLSYYSLLTCCRALLYSVPYNIWKPDNEKNPKNKNNPFLEPAHDRVIKLTKDYLNHLDKDFAEKIFTNMKKLKEWRELFSYKFPASGVNDNEEYPYGDLIESCGILCELAQLSSEQLQKYIFKNCINNFEEWIVTTEKLEVGYKYKTIIDKEDWYRIDYIKRRQPFPANIYYTMTEGMVEDYFDSWLAENDSDEIFNDYDLDWRLIFPCP